MDLARMLRNCIRDQWKATDLDWSRPPRPLERAQEEAVVQYFTNMAGIERLAGELFREQRDRSKEIVLRAIFQSFVIDEERHADVAERLARHYDVHRYRRYEPDPALVRFTPHFKNAVRHLSAEVANVYITTGELILDVALLRALDDYVADDTVHAAMEKINRDESRHIAIDFHMFEYYSSDAYVEALAKAPPRSLVESLGAWWSLAGVFRHAAPFFREVFFGPMDLVDPSGRRIREAFKRIQLLETKDRVARRPFSRFLHFMQTLQQNPVTRPVLGPLAVRVLGLRPWVLECLYSAEEGERAAKMSFDDLADDALRAKYTFGQEGRASRGGRP
jgi:hypothetical protein